ncbi:MAG: hypothetical protein Q7U54_21835 [Bacteroidales bacterium]|nr:hypothetical protein [Bacteroidales bacterium]
MRRNGKIIKMNPGNGGDGFSMFLIYRKNTPSQNPNNENENTKNHTLTRAVPMRALRN